MQLLEEKIKHFILKSKYLIVTSKSIAYCSKCTQVNVQKYWFQNVLKVPKVFRIRTLGDWGDLCFYVF